MTFAEMAAIEPRLGELKLEAIKFMDNSPGASGKRAGFWYHVLKPKFKRLCGFMAEKEKLNTCEAYDLAYLELCTILKIW